MTPVGAGHEQWRMMTGADPGGGKFDSGGVYIQGASTTTGVAGDLPEKSNEEGNDEDDREG